MSRTKALLLAVVILAVSQVAFGQGNIVITGHDSDLHCGPAAQAQLTAIFEFVRSGAPDPSLPVLTFNHPPGDDLTGCLTAIGVPWVNIDPDIGVPDPANFDVAIYSAVAVASDETCGGCDNTATSIANLTAAAASFEAFLNDGGGIVGLSGADRADTYYGFLPQSASGGGDPPSSGFVQIGCGVDLGIPAVNGDATHNFFPAPGTGGVSDAYCEVEEVSGGVEPNRLVTLACIGCEVDGGVIVPMMPSQLAFAMAMILLGTGAFILLWRARRLV